MIKGIVFDLGGVVLNYTNYPYYEYLSRTSRAPVPKIEGLIENGEKGLIKLLEEGKRPLGLFEKSIAKELKIKAKDVGWSAFYKKTVTINKDVEELVQILHKDYKTAFLTNTDIARYLYTLKILDLGLFDYRFVSCYIGHRKPDPRIYNCALERMDLAPEETVFIDDREENVEGARRIGITAIQFKDRRTLDRELARLHL